MPQHLSRRQGSHQLRPLNRTTSNKNQQPQVPTTSAPTRVPYRTSLFTKGSL